MTDTSNQTSPTPAPVQRRGRGRTALIVAAIALTGGLAGAFATKAISGGHAWGRGGHHGGPMGAMGYMGGPMDPAKIERRAERMAEGFSRRVDATGEQQAKLVTIAKAAAKDIAPLQSQVREARKQALKLMAEPKVDRAALEALRGAQLSNMDAVSKRMVTAMADAAEVLTPEQRQKVAERMERRGEGRRGWGKGWGGGPGNGGDQAPEAAPPKQ